MVERDRAIYRMPVKQERPRGSQPAEIAKRFNLLDAAGTTPEGKELYETYDKAQREASGIFLSDTAEAREVWDQVCRAAGRKRDKAVHEVEKAYQAGINKVAEELAQDPRYSVWAESEEEKARREEEAHSRRRQS